MTSNSLQRIDIYCRISQDRSGEMLGVHRQRERCEALAVARGWDVVAVHEDNDFGASSGRTRPGPEALIASRSQYDAILVWRLDRLLRSQETLIRVLGLKALIHTVEQGDIDVSTSVGRMFLSQEPAGESTEGAVSAQQSAGRFVVEGVGLSVLLSQQSFPSNGVLTPHDFVSASEVVDAAAGWHGTRDHVRRVTMHSSSDKSLSHAPKNALVRDGAPLVATGEIFSVTSVRYEVESVQIVSKGEIPVEVFSDAPGRLVVVTCSPEGTPSSTSNMVIVAHEVG